MEKCEINRSSGRELMTTNQKIVNVYKTEIVKRRSIFNIKSEIISKNVYLPLHKSARILLLT